MNNNVVVYLNYFNLLSSKIFSWQAPVFVCRWNIIGFNWAHTDCCKATEHLFICIYQLVFPQLSDRTHVIWHVLSSGFFSQCSSSSHWSLHQRFQLVRHGETHQKTPCFQGHHHLHVSFHRSPATAPAQGDCCKDFHLTQMSDIITAEVRRIQLHLSHLQHQPLPLKHPRWAQTSRLVRRKQRARAPPVRNEASVLQSSPALWTESKCFSTTFQHQNGRGWPATLSHILFKTCMGKDYF